MTIDKKTLLDLAERLADFAPMMNPAQALCHRDAVEEAVLTLITLASVPQYLRTGD